MAVPASPEHSSNPEAAPETCESSDESKSRTEEVNDNPPKVPSRSLQRYDKAIKRLKDATKIYGDDWSSFEFAKLDQLREYEDVKVLQTEINKVLDSGRALLENTEVWSKVKAIVGKGVLALTGPFVQNALSTAT